MVESPRKRPQRITVRKFGKSRDGRDKTVVQQGLSILNPADTGHDSEDARQKQVGLMAAST